MTIAFGCTGGVHRSVVFSSIFVFLKKIKILMFLLIIGI